MSFHGPISGGVPVCPASDPDRDLITEWLARNPVTLCPPDRRVSLDRPAPKAGIPPAERLASDLPHTPATDRSRQTGQRVMSIQQALEWAFGTENAQLDFDTTGAREFDRVGVDPIWRGMKMAELGCAVDGGGSSDPAADAQIIAGAVETLPVEYGGQRMAVQIAELARARGVPDWRVDARVVPAGAETVRGMEAESIWRFRTPCRHYRAVRGEYCPVVITGSARIASAKRRAYFAWLDALGHLAVVLRRPGALIRVEITTELPPLTPWKVSEGPGR